MLVHRPELRRPLPRFSNAVRYAFFLVLLNRLLNVFLELWRYDSTVQCTQARRVSAFAAEGSAAPGP